MSIWQEYPADYRAHEIEEIIHAVRAGECVSVVGLSGSGKSNLMGFLAHRIELKLLAPRFLLVDCNRLLEPTADGLFRLTRQALGANEGIKNPETNLHFSVNGELNTLESVLASQLSGEEGISLLLDRFDTLTTRAEYTMISSNLRALRDAYKYRLTYITATRRPLDPHTELSELFYGHSLWLGPLSKSDALWSARRDARRFSGGAERDWSDPVLAELVRISAGYPSFLRAACEAYAAGAVLEAEALRDHPAVARRVDEFWADGPEVEMIEQSRLAGHPFLEAVPRPPEGDAFDTSNLTAKENKLLEYFIAHAGEVCEKDDLVRAVWPEDVIYERGIRDESLAQLVRRLRVKIEPDPGQPNYIHTVPGRGYLFRC